MLSWIFRVFLVMLRAVTFSVQYVQMMCTVLYTRHQGHVWWSCSVLSCFCCTTASGGLLRVNTERKKMGSWHVRGGNARRQTLHSPNWPPMFCYYPVYISVMRIRYLFVRYARGRSFIHLFLRSLGQPWPLVQLLDSSRLKMSNRISNCPKALMKTWMFATDAL